MKNITKYFGVIFTKDDVVNKKPDPEIILMSLERMDAQKRGNNYCWGLIS